MDSVSLSMATWLLIAIPMPLTVVLSVINYFVSKKGEN
jgi:hypothetical protein